MEEVFNKVLKKLIAVIGVLYLIIPSLSLLESLASDGYIKWHWITQKADELKILEDYQFSFTFIILGFVFLVGFYLDGIKKHRLSDIAGILGLTLTCFSFGFMYHFDEMIWLVILSGWLAAYCFIIPVVEVFSEKIGETNWEKFFVVGAPSFLVIYFSGYNADILLSNIFEINPSHFPYTKPLAAVVSLSPFVFFSSFIAILIMACILCLKKGNDNQFRQLAGFFSLIVTFSLSFVLWGRGMSIIENVAVEVDFNPSSICQLDKDYDGYIYLDPAYQFVLVYDSAAENDAMKHFVAKCNMKTI